MKFDKTIHIIIIAVLLICVVGFLNAWAEEGALEQFISGESHYKKGEYEQAIKAYEEIIAAGKTSGEIYYNLGNSYFKDQQLGKAIVNYQRALQLLPRDSDLRFNYQHARSKTKGLAAVAKRGFLQRVSKGFIDFYTIDELAAIVYFCVVLLGGIYFLGLFLKWKKNLRIVTLVITSLFLIVYLSAIYHKVNHIQGLAVILADTRANFEPREESTSHFTINQGLEVKIIKRSDGWVKIKRSDDKMGWIEADFLEAI